MDYERSGNCFLHRRVKRERLVKAVGACEYTWTGRRYKPEDLHIHKCKCLRTHMGRHRCGCGASKDKRNV